MEAGADQAATVHSHSNRSLGRAREAGASTRTVHIALAANATIAVAKIAGGLLSGSTAMLAEAAHSIADTTNQAFLRASIALGQREASPRYPFGHGQERFLWTFMAAVGMFLAGAVFAIGYGAYELLHRSHSEGGYAIAYAVLAIAFLAEGSSWRRALRQTRREAEEAGMPTFAYARASRDPNVKMVLFEDTVALIGIALAAVGIGLDQITGAGVFDPAASVLIGVMLVGVAFWMGNDTKHLLVGAPARPDEVERIEQIVRSYDEIDDIVELLTLVLGPNALLVATRVDLRDGISSERVEEIASEIDRRLREAVPDVTEVFLDPTPPRLSGPARDRPRTRQPA
jgi:cation diffusion facilitator family transporter